MISENGNNINNFLDFKTKKTEETDVKKLIENATKDGIVTPEEREAIFDAGYKIKDEAKVQELKQGIPTDYEDISKAFSEGHDAGIKSDSLSKLVHDYSYGKLVEGLNKEAKGTQNSFRKLAAWMEEGADTIKQTLQELSRADDTEKNHDPLSLVKSGLKGVAGLAGDGIGVVKNGLHDLSLPDSQENEISKNAESRAEQAGAKAKETFASKKVNVVKTNYEKKEADLVNCVVDALKGIGFKDVKKTGVININEDLLKKMTGQNWDAIDIAKTDPAKLKEYLSGAEGKAMVSDGGHAYVYKGIDEKTGNLMVQDATVNINKIISKNNVAATVYVQNKGDGDLTGKAEGDKNVSLFNGINKLGNINSVDKTNGSSNESWQIRKLLVLMSDPTQALAVRKIADAVKLNDIGKLGEELGKKGIKLDNRELKAMATILNARIDDHGKSTTMIDKFLWLNKSSNGNLTEKQTNYIKAVEYSNVDLNNYFSSATIAGDRAKNMLAVLEDIMAGGEGC